jgi:hypothetical protein
MKIETYGKDNFSIFINNHYIKDDIYDDKDNLIKYIKNYLLNMRRKLNLRGFYKVRVYYKKIIGVLTLFYTPLNILTPNTLRIIIEPFIEKRFYL